MDKHFLFLMRHAPYGGLWAQETIDMLLTTAAFDQKIRVLFLDDGVFQLLSGQQPGTGRKAVGTLLGALSLYDVDDIWVERESLQERGLSPEQLLLPAAVVARREVAALLNQADVLVGC